MFQDLLLTKELLKTTLWGHLDRMHVGSLLERGHAFYILHSQAFILTLCLIGKHQLMCSVKQTFKFLLKLNLFLNIFALEIPSNYFCFSFFWRRKKIRCGWEASCCTVKLEQRWSWGKVCPQEWKWYASSKGEPLQSMLLVTAGLKSVGFDYIEKHNFYFFNSCKQLLLMTFNIWRKYFSVFKVHLCNTAFLLSFCIWWCCDPCSCLVVENVMPREVKACFVLLWWLENFLK